MAIALQTTMNYKIFKHDASNRSVNNLHVGKIARSMKKYGYIKAYPVHVIKDDDGFFRIMDGQHRVEAARVAKVPVYYVVSKTDDISISEINNTQKKWGFVDYVNSYANQGNDEYVKLKDFSEKHNLTVRMSAMLLSGKKINDDNMTGACVSRAIKDGTFMIVEPNIANEVVAIVESLRTHCEMASNAQFIAAIAKIVQVPRFSIDRFCNNARRLSSTIKPCATLIDYLDMCERIYNEHASKSGRVPLRFMAVQY